MPSGCVCAWGGVDVEVNDSRLLATLNAAGGELTFRNTATLCVLPAQDGDVQVRVISVSLEPGGSASAWLVRATLSELGVAPPPVTLSHAAAGFTATV